MSQESRTVSHTAFTDMSVLHLHLLMHHWGLRAQPGRQKSKGQLVLLVFTLRLTPAILRSRMTNRQRVLIDLAQIRLSSVTKLHWEHSPLPRDRVELRNIRYKTFKSYLIYSHFALSELKASQTSCSHQGSASTALLS